MIIHYIAAVHANDVVVVVVVVVVAVAALAISVIAAVVITVNHLLLFLVGFFIFVYHV